MRHAPLQDSESCTTALTADVGGLTTSEAEAGNADGISTIPDNVGNDGMSQPIPLSNIRNQVDDDSMAANQVGSTFPFLVGGVTFCLG